jgi:hypothetical protein
MAGKAKAARVGAGATAAGRAARRNVYLQRLVEDEDLRKNLRSAFDSARKAYGRMNGKSPAAMLDDRRLQRELRDTASSLTEAAQSLQGAKKRRRRGRMLLLLLVGGGLAVALSESLRERLLDLVLGKEEEFEYTSTTSPPPPASPPPSTEPVGTS